MGSRIKVGERSQGLVVLEIGIRTIGKNWLEFKCRCDCGRMTKLTSASFRRRKHCQDCSAESGAKKRTTHGAANSRMYRAWQGMKSRCENPNHSNYQWYGAKGVTVCQEWQDFAKFREWALSHGWQSGLTLDRNKAHLGYSPDNCEFVTKSENSKRMRGQYHFVRKAQLMCFYDEPAYGDF